ncbi:hypothetical protein J5N97_026666 [Dioscorea zingiberensis]|uniref:Starch synthase catalytic domain-containing protein n=1 Tax=Dioscorea zingiberensis TaxID=325984 RepID=A0A9D5C3D0_9LILI|nr:hypothetical protein J5N97_026666 [Dioscorea zingiberensis]
MALRVAYSSHPASIQSYESPLRRYHDLELSKWEKLIVLSLTPTTDDFKKEIVLPTGITKDLISSEEEQTKTKSKYNVVFVTSEAAPYSKTGGLGDVFVDHPSYHRPGSLYGDEHGTFGDNQFRFTLLCHAACEAPLVLPLGGYTYGENCLFIVNDWHASLVPALLGAKYRPHGVYKDARSILVIHNLAHQGVEPAITYEKLGLPPEWYGALEWIYPTWARKHAHDTGATVNMLKGAIVTADRILTVSQGYAWEITTPEGGQGLNELLSSRGCILDGITNGIDVDVWNPASDKLIPFNYSVDDLSGKIGFIGRLDYQKGTDLILSAMPELLKDDVQFIMLGSGDPATEQLMRLTESSYSDKFRGWVGYNEYISHQVTAG